MKKMKNSEIIAAHSNLVEIINKGEKYPVKFSYALTRNFRKLESLMKTFEDERNKLLDQYNVKNEAGEPAYKETGKIDIAEECKAGWTKDMAELLDIEVDFEPYTIQVENFPDSIEPGMLYALDFMIAE